MINDPLPTGLERFGERLQWAIENNDKVGSQAELCRLLGVSSPYVTNLVKKAVAPGKKALGKLSRTLGVPESWLAYGATDSGDSDANEPAPRVRADLRRVGILEELAALLREDRRMIEDRQEAILNMSKAALIEAEKAPNLSQLSSSDLSAAIHDIAVQLWQMGFQGGGSGEATPGNEVKPID